MKILMTEEELEEDISRLNEVDVSFHGRDLDHRGAKSLDFINEKSNTSIKIEYDVIDKVIIINEKETIIIDEFYDYFDNSFSGKSLLLETTTLGLPELLILIRAARNSSIKELFMVYWEPYHYKRQGHENILNNRDFELSGEVLGYKAIPGFAPLMLDDPDLTTQTIFCLGFEASRLDRAFEENQMIDPINCSLIFGIPAFNPGWEMNSFANNLRVIQERKLLGPYYYCAASNPLATYSYLKKLKKSLTESTENMIVSPIGTKPAGIGVALFVAEFQDVGILYDHPVKEIGRSKELGNRHIYEINFDE